MEAREKWEDCTKEEKTELLIRWFKYVERDNYTYKDLARFEILAETRPDDVFNYIVNLWYTKESWSLSKLIENMYFGDLVINATLSNIINRDNLDAETIELLDELREDMFSNMIYYGYLFDDTFESGGSVIEEQSGPKLKG